MNVTLEMSVIDAKILQSHLLVEIGRFAFPDAKLFTELADRIYEQLRFIELGSNS